MDVIDHARASPEEWRPGVSTRMLVSALVGARQLCIFEQACAEGTGAPTHLHDVEEVLTVQEGRAEIWLDEARMIVAAGQSVVIAPGIRHGFRNVGTGMLRVQAILASPSFEAVSDDGETRRRWQAAG